MTGRGDVSTPSFLSDHMLGTLARWLRLLGFDTAYPEPPQDDDALLDRMDTEGRILLTRDRDLADRGGSRALYVASDDLDVQVLSVLRAFNLSPADPLSRCSLCNAPLEEADKGSVEGEVPVGVFESQERFWRCRSCGQIYWQGSHWERIGRKISAYEAALRGEGSKGG